MGLFDFFKKNKEKRQEELDKGLEKTKTSLLGRISKAVLGKSTIDDDVLDELEQALLLADVGVDTTVKIIDRIRDRVAKEKYNNAAELDRLLKDEIAVLFQQKQAPGEKTFLAEQPRDQHNTPVPYVIMVVGVNGVGKTTTIGKLANLFNSEGHKVVLGAADTFRAAAVDQLKIWGQRAGVPVIDKGMGADPAAVAYDAVNKAIEMNASVVIIDTAGRLHNKGHLMQELSKIKRSIAKRIDNAPHETLLVLDASTGQNALMQAQEFASVTDLTAIALTKLDGTAKGGIAIAISDKFKVPVKYLGVGEGMKDIQLFDAHEFVESLFGK